MPFGTAHIVDGFGWIEEEGEPDAEFLPEDYPDVQDGLWVSFDRDAQDPTKAINVEVVADPLSFVRMVNPATGLTSAAERLVTSHAFELIVSTDPLLSGKAGTRERVDRVRDRFAVIAPRISNQQDRVGVAAVRRAIAKL